MREVILGKNAAMKLRKGLDDLFASEFEKNISGLYPGQFVKLVDEMKKINYLAHCFSVDKKFPLFKVHQIINGVFDYEKILLNSLQRAIEFRNIFKHYHGNMRLVFGNSDNLPGMVIDSYSNFICINLSTCAYDPLINSFIEKLKEYFPDKKIYVSGKDQERIKFGQPQLQFDSKVEEILAVENGIEFTIKPEVFQKNGFYFDHRENRIRAINTLKNLNLNLKNGLDLFSYLGAWGLSFLKESLCENIKFVDQADLAESFAQILKANKLTSSGEFIRADVFEYLNQEIKNNKKYDIICCDPPAFAKGLSAKKSALVGYKKLNTANLSLLNSGGIYIAASCTHYVTMDEFQASVFESALHLGKSIRMLDIGIQSADHGFSHFASKQNYIKYFLYFVE